jgi:hypothetical protein
VARYADPHDQAVFQAVVLEVDLFDLHWGCWFRQWATEADPRGRWASLMVTE